MIPLCTENPRFHVMYHVHFNENGVVFCTESRFVGFGAYQYIPPIGKEGVSTSLSTSFLLVFYVDRHVNHPVQDVKL